MEKKLFKSPIKKLCGVCGGLADYFNVDPTVIRIAVVLISVYTAVIPALVVYFVLALVIPNPPENYYDYYGRNNGKKLTKGADKTISGVCSGFAEYFGIDTTIIRILFVFLVLYLGTGLFAYIACAIIMPQPTVTCGDQFTNNPYNQNGFNGENQPPYNN